MSLRGIEGHRFSHEFLAAFEVEEVVGSGMSGIVLRAYQLSLGRQVAIKFLNKQSINAEELKWRFQREAHILAELSHPNIIKIFDYGFDGDTPFLVQEFLEGATLEDWLQVDAALTHEQVLDIAIAIARALALAHEKAVLHRDIKPANIFCCEDNRFVLLDFGLSISDEFCTALTKTGFVVGTPVYMAPEQMKSEAVSGPADINSLGLVLFHLLSRRFPFDFMEKNYFHKRMMEETPSLASFAPTVPLAMTKVVDKCLELSPSDRYQNGGELLNALLNIDLEKSPTVVITPFSNSISAPIEDNLQSSWFKALPLILPCLLTLLLLFVHWSQGKENVDKPLLKRHMSLAALFPTEVAIDVSASPSCRATVNLYEDGQKEPSSTVTKLVNGTARVEFILQERQSYRLVTIFAGRPQKKIERFISSPKATKKSLAVPDDLPRGKFGLRFVAQILTNGQDIAVVTKEDGIFCSSLAKGSRWYIKGNGLVQSAVANRQAIFAISSTGSVSAHSWKDGRLMWQSMSFGLTGKHCHLAKDRIFFRTLEPKQVVALSQSHGELIWKSPQMDFSENWNIVENKVLAPLISGGSKSIDIVSGNTSNGPQMAGSGFITTSFVGDKERIYVGNYVRAILGGPWHGPRLFRTYLKGEPRILKRSGDNLFVLCKAPNELVVLRADDGKILWSHQLVDVINHIEISKRRIYLVELGGKKPSRLKVLQMSSGKELALHYISDHQPAKPVLYDQGVLISPIQSILYALPLHSIP